MGRSEKRAAQLSDHPEVAVPAQIGSGRSYQIEVDEPAGTRFTGIRGYTLIPVSVPTMSGWGSQRISASADALPLTRGLIDTLAAPRAAGTTATLAPAREAAPSIHASLVRATEDDMTGGMQDLRVDTVERNAELVRQLDDVAARTEAASRTLTDEVIARRVAAFDAQRARVEAALASLEAEFSARITSTFAAHDASLREPSSRLDAACAAEADCYTRELPHLYDSCCGAAERRMRVEQEALQLDMAGVRRVGGVCAREGGRVCGW